MADPHGVGGLKRSSILELLRGAESDALPRRRTSSRRAALPRNRLHHPRLIAPPPTSVGERSECWASATSSRRDSVSGLLRLRLCR